MGRLIITTVGTSLLDENTARNDLVRHVRELSPAREAAKSAREHLGLKLDEIHRRKADEPGLRAEIVGQYGSYGALGELPEQLVAASAQELVDGMLALWRSERVKNQAQRREASPAELASLSLLKPLLGPEDALALLYSDTPAGAFCAACIQEMLRQGITNVTLNGEPFLAEPRRVEWLDPQCKDAFEKRAVGHLASAVADLYYEPRETPPTKVLLNVTGGYKAAIPILTLIAGLLGNVRVICLFEKAAALLYQPVVPISLGSDETLAETLQRATTGELRRAELEESEKIYFRDTDPPELSSLGLAVHEVLAAQFRRERRKLG